MSWTDQRIDHLKTLWEKGLTASQIADELGGVSRNAVIGKAHRLGLKSRPSPVKANEPEKKAAAKKALSPAKKKIAEVMHEFKEGELHSGKSDVIVTGGGLMGKVTKVADDHVEVEIAPNVRVRAVKSTLVNVTPRGTKAAND